MRKLWNVAIAIVLLVSFLGVVNTPTHAQKFTYISGIQVQNPNTGDATISFSYYDTSTGTLNGTAITDTVLSGASNNYYPHPAAGFNGSLVISSDKQLAVVSNLQKTDGTARASYVGASAGSTSVYLPTLMTKNGANDTWFSVQNTGTLDTTISVDYSDCTTGEPTGLTIKPGASISINNAIETCHSGKVYSAVVTSSNAQPLVAVAVQEKPNVMYAYTGASSLGSLNPVMPTVTFNNAGNQTGVQVQNTSGSDSNVTITYTPSSVGGAGTTCTETQSVLAGQSVTFGWPAFYPTAPAGYAGTSSCVRGQRFIGSAKVTANSGSATLNSVVNQAKAGTNRAGAYSAFDPSKATAKIAFPLILDRRGSSAKLITAFNLMNLGTDTYVKCTFVNAGAYEFKKQVLAGEVVTENQTNKIAANYLGSGICLAYSDSGYTTLDAAAKLVAVVNETGTVGPTTWDTLMIYEGINVAP
jgi:hypothetical protein